MSVTFAQKEMLRKVAAGRGFGEPAPYQVGNTNRTADALERKGLIEEAADQSGARRTLCVAWVLTDKGREALK